MFNEAIALYERKGELAGANRAHQLFDSAAAAEWVRDRPGSVSRDRLRRRQPPALLALVAERRRARPVDSGWAGDNA